ncbi:hypothetical protein HS125_10285 [bacterium]|nr:hypothetical protein [bacterium]
MSLPNADPERLAVTGLSGGGWQTIILSSLDTRVKLSMPVAGYSGFRTRARQTWDLGDSEQAPVDLAMTADYTHLTCFLAPRPARLTYNAKDNCCCFKAEGAATLVEAASPVYQLLGAPERLRTHVNHDEGHNYGVDNRQTFYTMLRDFFYDGRADWNTTEIDSASEYKTPAELTVPVPEGNATFNSLARQLAQTLPRDATVPGEPAELAAWQNRKREELAQIVRWQDYEVKVVGSTPETAGPVAATWWRLATFDADETWTLCAVEVAKGEAKRTVMLVADGGHAGATREVEELVNAGARVFVVDPLFIGESAFDWNPVRYSVHISSSGGRPMGIQASQLAAVARWVKKERGAASLSLVSIGPRAGLAALVAAGLEPEAFAELETRGGMRTLQEIIEKDTSIDAEPTYFTFGLLEAFDIPQLSALVVPRPMAMK